MICRWKGFKIIAWHVGDEHIHLYAIIPPKFSVAYAMAILKGKSSAWIKKKTKKFPLGSFWARGYFVSTIGLNEKVHPKPAAPPNRATETTITMTQVYPA